jgi:hypothetical protein
VFNSVVRASVCAGTVVATNAAGTNPPSSAVPGTPEEQVQGLDLILIEAVMDN